MKKSLVEMLEERAAKAANGPWVPAGGGKEVSFYARSGKRMHYMWQPSTGRHAYYDCDSDLFMSDEEAAVHLGV